MSNMQQYYVKGIVETRIVIGTVTVEIVTGIGIVADQTEAGKRKENVKENLTSKNQ